MEYQGWTNYETWLIANWLQNDEGLYNAIKDAIDENEDDESFSLGAFIRDYVEEITTDDNPLKSDIISGFLSSVVYDEIAESFKEDLK